MSDRRRPKPRGRLRPVELVGASAVLGIFVGAVVILGTREWLAGLEWAGVAFVVALVVTAMLLLAVTPKEERPDAERRDDDGPSGH